MRTRLAATYLVLIVLVLVGLAVPLAMTVAAGRSEEMATDRFADAARFASLADPVLGSPSETFALEDELRSYHDLYGIAAAVADREGNIVVSAGDLAALQAPTAQRRLRQALAGVGVGGGSTIWPWQTEPLAVAVPVTSGGETVGAVVTLSPTDAVRADILRSWGVVAGGVLLAGGIFVAVALALTRWILRPVAELDDAAHRMSITGDLDVPVPAALGPPELRRLTRSFNEMAESVADVLRRQREFVAQASHQMRNPLTALMLRVEALGDFIDSPAGSDEHRVAMEEADRLGRILDGLLVLAKAERGDTSREVVDAAVTADERVAAWRPLAARRGITLLRTGVAHAPVVTVPTAVGQSLDALIDNALKFAGPKATVQIDLRLVSQDTDDDTVELHVIDDGPGLTDDSRRRASERFWRAPESQNVDGSGLGLPIATVLVESSGGRLDLLPATPAGLDARLRFPAAPAGLNGPAGPPHDLPATNDRTQSPVGADQRLDSR